MIGPNDPTLVDSRCPNLKATQSSGQVEYMPRRADCGAGGTCPEVDESSRCWMVLLSDTCVKSACESALSAHIRAAAATCYKLYLRCCRCRS